MTDTDHDHDHDADHDHDHDPVHKHAASASEVASRDAASMPPLQAPRAGTERVLYLDCLAGCAGDMLVAALLDVGVPWEVVTDAVAALALDGYELTRQQVRISGFAATRFVVSQTAQQPARSYTQIRQLLNASTLGPSVLALALETFERLAIAEAAVHGVAVSQVHFHEVGALDSIADIVAACAALAHLDLPLWSSPLPLNRGFVLSEHGRIPLPAPAVLGLLKGVPTLATELSVELVTPTGAALLAQNVANWSEWPGGTLQGVGLGAGTRTLPDRPNLLRAVLLDVKLGVTDPAEHVVIEANLDDVTGELLGYTLERVLALGALDAWAQPVTMKKGRPGWVLSVLTERQRSAFFCERVLSETSSIGVRVRAVERVELPRGRIQVETPFGKVWVKVSGAGDSRHVKPEYEDCRRLAEQQAVPLRLVLQAALLAAQNQAL